MISPTIEKQIYCNKGSSIMHYLAMKCRSTMLILSSRKSKVHECASVKIFWHNYFLISVYILEVFSLSCAQYKFLRKDLSRNKFLPMHTNVKYTLVFSLFDNIFWKLSSKLIENVWCSGPKSFLINTSVKYEQFNIPLVE